MSDVFTTREEHCQQPVEQPKHRQRKPRFVLDNVCNEKQWVESLKTRSCGKSAAWRTMAKELAKGEIRALLRETRAAVLCLKSLAQESCFGGKNEALFWCVANAASGRTRSHQRHSSGKTRSHELLFAVRSGLLYWTRQEKTAHFLLHNSFSLSCVSRTSAKKLTAAPRWFRSTRSGVKCASDMRLFRRDDSRQVRCLEAHISN